MDYIIFLISAIVVSIEPEKKEESVQRESKRMEIIEVGNDK